MLTPRIAILHAHNTLNYGSMMMCENVIYYLSKLLPGVSFVVLSDHMEETENRLKKATGLDNIMIRPRTISVKNVNTIFRWMPAGFNRVILRYRKIGKTIEDCNVVLVLGGDDISEYYGAIRLLDILMRLRYLKKTKKRVYLLGQTIGPFHSWRIPIARMVLEKMDKIYHRGPISHNYVSNGLGVKGNSFISSDLAFLDLARQHVGFDIEKYNLQIQKYITFVPSGFWSSYCQDYKTYFNGLLHVKNHLLRICEQRNLKLVLLPHVLRSSDDRALVRQMIAGDDNNQTIVAMTDPLLPFEAREILGKSYLVVSQRMHGAISSLQRGVPAVCLSYSVKFSEVVGEYLGLPELVIEIEKSNFEKDLDKACSGIDSILANIASLKGRIEKSVNVAKRDAEIQIEDIAKDILS